MLLLHYMLSGSLQVILKSPPSTAELAENASAELTMDIHALTGCKDNLHGRDVMISDAYQIVLGGLPLLVSFALQVLWLKANPAVASLVMLQAAELSCKYSKQEPILHALHVAA